MILSYYLKEQEHTLFNDLRQIFTSRTKDKNYYDFQKALHCKNALWICGFIKEGGEGGSHPILKL